MGEVEVVRRTYRGLRLGLIGVVVALAAAVLADLVPRGHILSSISAYYYTPVRNVFVGSLLAGSLALIVVRGRIRNLDDSDPVVGRLRRFGRFRLLQHENLLLNLSGLLLPIVAFVPTRVEPGTVSALGDFSCPESFRSPDGKLKCVPDAFFADVQTGLWALVAVGLFALVASVYMHRRRWAGANASPERSRDKRALTISGTVFGLLAVGFLTIQTGEVWTEQNFILRHSHMWAAVIGVGLLAVVALINWAASSISNGYRILYATSGWLLVGALVIGLVGWMGVSIPVVRESVVFWVEAIVLLGFAIFWTAQTLEWWDPVLPTTATEVPPTDQDSSLV